jgi:hypothetical protein
MRKRGMTGGFPMSWVLLLSIAWQQVVRSDEASIPKESREDAAQRHRRVAERRQQIHGPNCSGFRFEIRVRSVTNAEFRR